VRYCELIPSDGWRHYTGREQVCCAAKCSDQETDIIEVKVGYGILLTGKSRVFKSYWVGVENAPGHRVVGEDAHSIRRALRAVEKKLNAEGLSLQVIGLNDEWRESGLSANSGYGYHPHHKIAVHMLEPKFQS
jgi:hypothetical protein